MEEHNLKVGQDDFTMLPFLYPLFILPFDAISSEMLIKSLNIPQLNYEHFKEK
jgi:hypothetical protein